MRLIRIAIAAEQRTNAALSPQWDPGPIAPLNWAAAVAFSVRLFYWVDETQPDRILELLGQWKLGGLEGFKRGGVPEACG